MDTVEDFKEWLKEICPGGDTEKYIKCTFTACEMSGSEKIYKINLYTSGYDYSITARRDTNGSYLGCIVNSRKALAGESWFRGNDLPDGKLCRETWENIKNSIIRYELEALNIRKPSLVDEPIQCTCGPREACSKC